MNKRQAEEQRGNGIAPDRAQIQQRRREQKRGAHHPGGVRGRQHAGIPGRCSLAGNRLHPEEDRLPVRPLHE